MPAWSGFWPFLIALGVIGLVTGLIVLLVLHTGLVDAWITWWERWSR
jgi:hypothetical protein